MTYVEKKIQLELDEQETSLLLASLGQAQNSIFGLGNIGGHSPQVLALVNPVQRRLSDLQLRIMALRDKR